MGDNPIQLNSTLKELESVLESEVNAHPKNLPSRSVGLEQSPSVVKENAGDSPATI